MKNNDYKKRALLVLLLILGAVAMLISLVFMPNSNEIADLNEELNKYDAQIRTDNRLFTNIEKNKETMKTHIEENSEATKEYYGITSDDELFKDMEGLMTNLKFGLTPNYAQYFIPEYDFGGSVYDLYQLDNGTYGIEDDPKVPLLLSIQIDVTFEGTVTDFKLFLDKVKARPTKYAIVSLKSINYKEDTATGNLSIELLEISRANYSDIATLEKYKDLKSPKLPKDIVDKTYREINWLNLVTDLFTK